MTGDLVKGAEVEEAGLVVDSQWTSGLEHLQYKHQQIFTVLDVTTVQYWAAAAATTGATDTVTAASAAGSGSSVCSSGLLFWNNHEQLKSFYFVYLYYIL